MNVFHIIFIELFKFNITCTFPSFFGLVKMVDISSLQSLWLTFSMIWHFKNLCNLSSISAISNHWTSIELEQIFGWAFLLSLTGYPNKMLSIHLSLIIFTHSLKCNAIFPAVRFSFVYVNINVLLLTFTTILEYSLLLVPSCMFIAVPCERLTFPGLCCICVGALVPSQVCMVLTPHSWLKKTVKTSSFLPHFSTVKLIAFLLNSLSPGYLTYAPSLQGIDKELP